MKSEMHTARADSVTPTKVGSPFSTSGYAKAGVGRLECSRIPSFQRSAAPNSPLRALRPSAAMTTHRIPRSIILGLASTKPGCYHWATTRPPATGDAASPRWAPRAPGAPRAPRAPRAPGALPAPPAPPSPPAPSPPRKSLPAPPPLPRSLPEGLREPRSESQPRSIRGPPEPDPQAPGAAGDPPPPPAPPPPPRHVPSRNSGGEGGRGGGGEERRRGGGGERKRGEGKTRERVFVFCWVDG